MAANKTAPSRSRLIRYTSARTEGLILDFVTLVFLPGRSSAISSNSLMCRTWTTLAQRTFTAILAPATASSATLVLSITLLGRMWMYVRVSKR